MSFPVSHNAGTLADLYLDYVRGSLDQFIVGPYIQDRLKYNQGTIL